MQPKVLSTATLNFLLIHNCLYISVDRTTKPDLGSFIKSHVLRLKPRVLVSPLLSFALLILLLCNVLIWSPDLPLCKPLTIKIHVLKTSTSLLLMGWVLKCWVLQSWVDLLQATPNLEKCSLLQACTDSESTSITYLKKKRLSWSWWLKLFNAQDKATSIVRHQSIIMHFTS